MLTSGGRLFQAEGTSTAKALDSVGVRPFIKKYRKKPQEVRKISDMKCKEIVAGDQLWVTGRMELISAEWVDEVW